MTDSMKLKYKIEAGDLNNLFIELYGSADQAQTERYSGLISYHIENFKNRPVSLFSASGRTELSGNHTDHNLGKVMAASIQLDTIAAVSTSTDSIVILHSMGFPACKVDLSNLEPVKTEEGTTDSLIRGIARAFSDRGCRISGFRASTTTSVLKGSGLSSSAALEVLVGTIFNSLFFNDKLTTTEIAQIGQYAENNYFNKPCGLMDQVACANGGIVEIDFADPANPVIVPVEYDFSSKGYKLMVVDTGGNHADLTPDYAAIPAEMKKTAALFGQKTLRGISLNQLIKKTAQIRKDANDRAFLRAFHFLTENERVVAQIAALRNDDIDEYLKLVNQSGKSSFQYLQNVFSPAAVEEQGISTALALTEFFLNGEGACRVHGGGFAGTIQVYIPLKIADDYIVYMEKVFGKGTVTPLKVRQTPAKRTY